MALALLLLSACSDVVAPTPPARVEIGSGALTLDRVGDTTRLRATVRDAFGNVLQDVGLVWSSSRPEVATVDDRGLVAGVTPGMAWIRAFAGEIGDSLQLQVEPPLLLESDVPDSIVADVGTTIVLRARVTDDSGAPRADVPVLWEVDAGRLETPSPVRTGSAGEAEVEWTLGTAPGVQRASASVERTGSPVTLSFRVRADPGPAVTALLVADSVLLSGTGESVRLSPALFDAFGNATPGGAGTVTWTAAPGAAVGVDAGGLVTALSEGAAVVHANVDGLPTDSIRIEVRRRGAITLTFDDGWRSVYEHAWPVIQDFPWLRANVGVYTEAVGWPGYLTEGQLDEFHGAGWSLVSHTVSHDSLSTLAPEELAVELRESRAWLEARGYRGAHVLIAPYHDFPPAARAAAAEFYEAARGASAHATRPETLVGWVPAAPLELTGIPADDLPYTTGAGLDRLRALLRRTVEEGAFLDLFLHQVPEENAAAFRDLLEVLDEFRDRVLPYHELFPVQPRVVR